MDFIHQFADHKDTVHTANTTHEGAVLEKSHHHCSFIDFHLMPFDGHQSIPFIAFAKCADYVSYTVLVASRFLSADVRQVSLRGPPVAVI